MLGKLISNTLAGALQAPLAAAKAVAGAAISPIDGGETMAQGLEDAVSAARKIGSSKDHDK